MNQLKIKKECLKIRRSLEFFQKELPQLDWDKDLMGACATGSALVKKLLKKHNIKSSIFKAQHKSLKFGNHAWIETDTLLIDLTFTQFNQKSPKVIIYKKTSHSYRKYRKNFPYPQKASQRSSREWCTQNPKNSLRIIKRKIKHLSKEKILHLG